MATERQIEANRRNAQKSTGPRSAAGKKRIGLNAWRHGLRSDFSRRAFSDRAEALARKFAGPSSDPIVLEHARAAAQAELELARVRLARLALIERVCRRGPAPPPAHVTLEGQLTLDKWLESGLASQSTPPGSPEHPAERAATSELERTAEAIRHIFPELAKLASYERRAASARDQAIRELSARLSAKPDLLR